MIDFIKKVLRIASEADFKELVNKGALIMDVRSPGEFNGGHSQGAQNFPLNTLSVTCQKVEKDRVIITCCASGARSASAKQMLQAKGYEKVYNGGGWRGLQNKIT